MIIRILAILLITFTPINTTPCKDNPTCECSSNDSEELNIACDIDNSTGFAINIKSRNNIKITCKNMEGWDQFCIKNNNLSEKVLQSLNFEHCRLSDGASLKDVAKRIGIKDTSILIFQSFEKLYATLKREHLQGFPSLKKLILSYNGFTKIPNDLLVNFPELEYIDLSNNDFDLPADIFHANPNLKKIILQYSGIDMIHEETFSKLHKLELVNIMSNHLLQIKPGTFDQLVSLRSLNLEYNYLSVLPQTIFHGLKKLEELDISMNSFSFIPSNLFEKNKELRHLFLHNNINNMSTLPDYLLANFKKLTEVQLNNNGFLFLPENLFWDSISLEDIFLNDNYLVTLPKDIFRGLKNVRKLILNNNKIESLPDKIFADMEKLLLLDLSNNLMVLVSSDLFHGLVSLFELNMERNRLKIIDNKSLYPLINLNIAKFSHNPLSLPYESQKLSVFHANEYLTELHLSNMSITHFFDNWTIGNNDLRFLDLSHNFIKSVAQTIFMLPTMDIVIDLSYNKIRNFNIDQIEEMISLRREVRNTFIHLEHNPFICDCSLYHLLRFRERKMNTRVCNLFNFGMVNLTCVQPDGSNEIEISKLNSSTYECLEHDYFHIKKLCQKNCICKIRPTNLTRIIDCSYKNMFDFFIDKTRVVHRKNIPFILNLTGNRLTEIPSTKPLSPLNVTGLLLSNNNISTITLDKLPKSLKVLELHNNNISYINSDVLMYLNSSIFEKFTLSGNPILCVCDNQNLLKFILSHLVYYEDLNNLTCKNTDLPINQIVIDAVCPFYQFYILIISITIIVLVTVGISLFYYKKNIKFCLTGEKTEYTVTYTRRTNEK